LGSDGSDRGLDVRRGSRTRSNGNAGRRRRRSPAARCRRSGPTGRHGAISADLRTHGILDPPRIHFCAQRVAITDRATGTDWRPSSARGRTRHSGSDPCTGFRHACAAFATAPGARRVAPKAPGGPSRAIGHARCQSSNPAAGSQHFANGANRGLHRCSRHPRIARIARSRRPRTIALAVPTAWPSSKSTR
jgi:hypothetical protein